jgi:ABC-type sugar transport system, permease component
VSNIVRKHRRYGTLAYQYALLIAVLVLFIGPLIWMLSTMLKTQAETYQFPPSILPDSFNLDSFDRLFEKLPNLWRWMVNSLIISVSVSVGTVISSSMVAFGFARFRNRIKGFLFLIVLATLMIPQTVLVVPSFMLYTKLGWIDSWLPLIVPAWLGGAYYIFLFRQFFLTIPLELDEATYLDGGGRGTVFTRVVLPLSKPVIMTAFIFSFVFSWLDFFGPFLYIRTNEWFTLSVGLQLLIGQESRDLPALAAGSFLSILPIAVIYFMAQKYLVEGVVLTGSKV